MGKLLTAHRTVCDLMADFECGDIAVPEIQRDIVWDADQIKGLLDSISQRFPCGSLIFWEPRETDKKIVQGMIRPERAKQLDSNKVPRYFLLDGQQRLTALASLLLKRDKLKALLCEEQEEMPFIQANVKKLSNKAGRLDEIEESSDRSVYKFPRVLINDLFDGTFEKRQEYGLLKDYEKESLRQFIQRVRGYEFPIQIISDHKYETVGEIFTRVNSQGTSLTGVEIQLAQIVPHWQGITQHFREYRRELRNKRYELDLTFLMRVISGIECKTPNVKKFAERVRSDDPPNKKHLMKTWDQTKSAINSLIKLLSSSLLLDKSKYITSKNVMVPLAFYLAQVQKRKPNVKDMKRFFIFSQLSEHYGSSADSQLRQDFKTLLTDDGDSTQIQKGLQTLVSDVNQEARRYFRGLKIKDSDVVGHPSKNVFVLLMYILMRRRKATDWRNDKVLPIQDIEPDDTQLHHIFPFNFMIEHKAAIKSYSDNGRTYNDYKKDINDVANFTFLSQEANVAICDTAPHEYLAEKVSKEMIKAHFIPQDQELWKPEKFSEFLVARRQLLAKAMTQFLKAL